MLSSLPGRLPFRGQRTGLQRPALSDEHPQVSAPLPLSLQRCGSRGPAGVARGPALFGDDLRLSLGSLRQDPGGLAQRVGPGDEPGRGGDGEDLAQLHAGPASLARLRGPQLHRPPAHQAQSGQLGATLPGERLAVLAAVMEVEAE